MKNQKQVICEYCKKIILENENRVNYSETNPFFNKVLIDLHFHTNCWIEHYNKSLDKHIENYSKKILGTVVPAIKNQLENTYNS